MTEPTIDSDGAAAPGAHGRGVRVAVRSGLAVATLVSAGLFALAGFAWGTYRSIDSGVTRLHLALPAPTATSDPEQPDQPATVAQNILLVGNDDRTNMTDAEVRELHVGRDGGSMATDTMMILHVPADGSRATLISLPRDSYVHIPGHGMNRLNAAYVDGYDAAPQNASLEDKRSRGANLLIKTVQNLTGVTINHYVQISLLGFYEVAKALDGIPVDLCHDVDDTVAYNRSIGSDGGSGFRMTAGHHTLNAVQALEFVRQRHNLPLGDLDRVRRQQYFLTAAFRQVASVGIITKLDALGDAIKRNVYLDPDLDLFDLARQMENLSADNISGHTIPFVRFWDDSPVGSVEQIDPAQVQAAVSRFLSTAPARQHDHGGHHHGTKARHQPTPIDSGCID